jgi:hypothetical protein
LHKFIFWIAEAAPVGASISADALLPLGAVAIGVAIGMIHVYSLARDKANAARESGYEIQNRALARRLRECEQSQDDVRAERDGYRDELADAHAEIADLKAKLERRSNAGT